MIHSKFSYNTILPALEHISSVYPAYPNLNDTALLTNLNAHIFRKKFRDWFGITTKEFTQHLVFLRARHSLRTIDSPFLQAELITSPVHLLPRESLKIPVLYYTIIETRFGYALVASDEKGIAALLFIDENIFDKNEAQLRELVHDYIWQYYPHVLCRPGKTSHTEKLEHRLAGDHHATVTLCVRATPFQLQVYKALLAIPSAQLRTYSEIARFIGNPNAVRAVGTAVARNPVSIIIPCHRIVPAKNSYGNYRWNSGRKISLLVWEAIQEKDFN